MNEPIINEQAVTAEFAESLWNNYIRFKMDEANINNVSYYRAVVTQNNGDGTLKVQQPYDNAIKVNSTSAMSGASVGERVVVARLGNSNAAMNHLVFAYASGSMYTHKEIAKGTYQHVTANTWECTNISFTLDESAFVYLRTNYVSRMSTGLGLSTASQLTSPFTMTPICYEASDARRTPVYYIPAGTYYIYDRRDGSSSATNTFYAYRVYV